MMKTLITLLAVLAGTLLPAKNESETLLASWTLKDEVLRSVNGESWPRKGLAFDDKKGRSGQGSRPILYKRK